MAFDDEKAIKTWMTVHAPSAGIYKQWKCKVCDKFHFIAYPQEISGNSSGKNTRKMNFLEQRGEDEE